LKVKARAVQPRVLWGTEEWPKAARAAHFAKQAADHGPVLTTFPEGYPGPSHGSMDSAGKLDQTPIEMLQTVAAQRGITIVASILESRKMIPDFDGGTP
jgi:predicted amidohydrolase